jgi:hypothetical protein
MRGRWSAAAGGAIALGLVLAANASPQAAAPAPTMAGAAVNFVAFRDRGGSNYVLQAPQDYAWLRLFGTKGSPVTRSTSLTCPTRRTATGAKYTYACSLIIADYAQGKYNVARPRVMRHADGEAVLTVDRDHSTLQIDLRATTVYDATTTPPRTRTEPARSAVLRQVPL